MPTYDYRCLDCGHSYEEFQKITDEPFTECPKCHGRVKRLIGAGAGMIFRGTGFYETDYKHKSNRPTSPVGSKKPSSIDKK